MKSEQAVLFPHWERTKNTLPPRKDSVIWVNRNQSCQVLYKYYNLQLLQLIFCILFIPAILGRVIWTGPFLLGLSVYRFHVCLSVCACACFSVWPCLPVLVFLKHYACLYVLTMQAPTVFIFGWHFPFIKLLHMTSKSTIPITSNLTPIDPGRVEYSTNIHVSCSNRSGPEFLDAPSFGQGSLSPIWISDRPVALERVQGRHGTWRLHRGLVETQASWSRWSFILII